MEFLCADATRLDFVVNHLWRGLLLYVGTRALIGQAHVILESRTQLRPRLAARRTRSRSHLSSRDGFAHLGKLALHSEI